MRNFPLHGFNKHIPWFRCSGKGEYLNPAQTHNSEANQLTANALQDLQQRYPRFRSLAGWNAAECKCAPEVLLAGVSTKRVAEQHRHLNRSNTRKIHCNSLRNFPLHGFNKHIPWFRCNGKGKHLNPAARQNPAAKPLTTNTLQDFQQLHPRFRSQAGLEYRGMQTCPGGASGRGTPERANRTAQASEPERNSNKPPQHIERLSITRIQRAHSLVQMQWQREASEPCIKAKSNRQPTHNKRIARFSTTAPKVQMPNGFGTAQNANTLWRYF